MQDQERIAIGNKIIKITIFLNILLTVLKLGVGYIGNSTAIIADGLHSASDIITSVGVIIGMFVAAKPKDEKHQYGHEKAESIAAFILSSVLVLTGVNIFYQSFSMILFNHMGIPTVYTAIVAFLSIIIKEYQFRITKKAAETLNSNALMSDAWHHRSDAFSSIAALIGILGARMGYTFLDPIAGIVVSLFVIKIGIQLLRVAVDELMDVTIDEEKIELLKVSIEKIEGIKAVTELRGRKHGSKAYVDMKICVDPSISVYKGHSIGEEAEKLILSHMNNVKEVIVHVDPCEHICKDECKKEEK